MTCPCELPRAITLAAVTIFTACSSAPDPAPSAPQAGPLPRLKEAPRPPLLDGVLNSAQAPRPKLPEARRQSIDEVFKDQHAIVGAPEDFALQPEEVVVIALPEELGLSPEDARRTRVQMATAFLKHGHLTKDAGRYAETTFRTNTLPDGDDRKQVSQTVRTDAEGTSEVVTQTTSASKPWYWDSWLAWRTDRGLRLSFSDPTSLWITQLGKYDATKSRYFVRVFDLEFGEAVEKVPLTNDLAAADVEQYRSTLTDYNQAIDSFNQQRRSFGQRTVLYRSDYENRKRSNAQTLDQYTKNFDTQWVDYQQQFRAWKARNPDVARLADVKEELRLPTPLPPIVTVKAPPARSRISEAELTKLLEDEAIVDVDVTTLRILAEVVDTESGEVKWAGEFAGKTRAGLGDRVRLLETFIDKALH